MVGEAAPIDVFRESLNPAVKGLPSVGCQGVGEALSSNISGVSGLATEASEKRLPLLLWLSWDRSSEDRFAAKFMLEKSFRGKRTDAENCDCGALKELSSGKDMFIFATDPDEVRFGRSLKEVSSGGATLL
jgi:hypothetical protein